MGKFMKSVKAFSVPYESWYGDSVKETAKDPYIMVGFYYENDGTDGEFEFVWTKFGIQLRAFYDSWEALSKMPELINLMAEIDHNDECLSIDEFCKRLENLGYKNITEYKHL